MKIASYETTILKVPEDEPLANMPEEEKEDIGVGAGRGVFLMGAR